MKAFLLASGLLLVLAAVPAPASAHTFECEFDTRCIADCLVHAVQARHFCSMSAPDRCPGNQIGVIVYVDGQPVPLCLIEIGA
jgi:hypothetical protein